MADISRQIAQGLTGAGGDGIAFSAVDTDPEAALDSGAYDAVIVLPRGLSDSVLSGEPAQLDVVGGHRPVGAVRGRIRGGRRGGESPDRAGDRGRRLCGRRVRTVLRSSGQ